MYVDINVYKRGQKLGYSKCGGEGSLFQFALVVSCCASRSLFSIDQFMLLCLIAFGKQWLLSGMFCETTILVIYWKWVAHWHIQWFPWLVDLFWLSAIKFPQKFHQLSTGISDCITQGLVYSINSIEWWCSHGNFSI
jgi:hypothetical protein